MVRARFVRVICYTIDILFCYFFRSLIRVFCCFIFNYQRVMYRVVLTVQCINYNSKMELTLSDVSLNTTSIDLIPGDNCKVSILGLNVIFDNRNYHDSEV